MAKEQRLIDANKLITDIQGTASEVAKTAPYSAEWFTRLHDRQCEIIEIIKGQAAVDAVEVVHGRWEDVQETEMYVPDMKFTITKTAETCSVCKARIGFVGGKRYLFDAICPNCGAKMDGKENQ